MWTAQKLLPWPSRVPIPCGLSRWGNGIERAATSTMLLLNRAQREMLVDKLPDVANLAIGALSFGQFLGDRPFSLTRALCGVAMWMILMAWTIALASGRNQT
ncbi:MAG: hypothetical protein ABIP49_01180 [Lysobacterales bacterium]